VPHIVEQVRNQRQRARVLGRFLRCAARNVGGKMIVLEAGKEKLGRAAHHLAQFRFAQRQHIDLPTPSEPVSHLGDLWLIGDHRHL
jgi:hypothetical protein